jgi:hypothetical protein
MDPHHFGNLDPHPDPHPHKMKNPHPDTSDNLDLKPDPHQFADDKPKCVEYEPILAIFQRF